MTRMLVFLCFLYIPLLLHSFAFGAKPTCGKAQRTSGFIVRGKKFTRGDFPWAVALFFIGKNSPMFFGGGTLISKRHVLTGKT